MTPEERSNPKILNHSRKQRIAKGSGRSIEEVNKLIKQFEETAKMMKMFGNKQNLANMMKNAAKMRGRKPF
jgi:signal recognition particle subunit SRP54